MSVSFSIVGCMPGHLFFPTVGRGYCIVSLDLRLQSGAGSAIVRFIGLAWFASVVHFAAVLVWPHGSPVRGGRAHLVLRFLLAHDYVA